MTNNKFNVNCIKCLLTSFYDRKKIQLRLLAIVNMYWPILDSVNCGRFSIS